MNFFIKCHFWLIHAKRRRRWITNTHLFCCLIWSCSRWCHFYVPFECLLCGQCVCVCVCRMRCWNICGRVHFECSDYVEHERVMHQQRPEKASAPAYCSVNDDEDFARNLCKFWIRCRKEWNNRRRKELKGNEKRTCTREINSRIENKIELKSHTNYNSHTHIPMS